MITGVVFWPQPPLLLPEYASVGDPAAEVRRAAFAALAAGRSRAEPVLLLTGAERCAPLGERVARALLAQAGADEPAAVVEVPADADAAAVAEAADRVRGATAAGPVTLLVAGDGTARPNVRAPERADPEAEAADERIAAALAAADPGALADLDPALATKLMICGRAPWQVAAAVVAEQQPRPAYAWFARPFEVGYHIAAWRMTDEHLTQGGR